MISFITVGRDDDYGKGFLNRLYLSVSKNIEVLEKLTIPYEYLVVEWCPFKNYLIYHDRFKNLFENKNLKDIVIKPNVAVAENLNPKIFYEYFAKNAGIRLSQYSALVVLNADVVLPEKTLRKVGELVKNKLDKKHYYRLLKRVQVDERLHKGKWETVSRSKDPDAAVGAYRAGEFLLIDRDTLQKYGQGYDETNPGHRTISQNNMDGEMLWNLYYHGITVQFLDADYWHLEHERSLPRDTAYNVKGYVNKPNWGFIAYPQKVISAKLSEIG